MGGKKNRRRQSNADWYHSGTDESDMNASGIQKISEFPATGGQREESTSNGQTDSPNGDGQSRDGKNSSPQHAKHKTTLGPWTHAVDEAVQGMDTAQRAINHLYGVFTAHINDLSRIDDLKRRFDELEGVCNEKDEVVKSHATTISTLRAMDHEAKAGIEDQLKQISKERKELKEERTKLKRRVEAATAEEQLLMQLNFEKLVARHDKTHETRMKELDVDFAQKSKENSTRVTALEAEKGQLLVTAEQQEKKLKAQADELDDINERYDILNRAKDSFKSEKEDLSKELEMTKKEFALDNKTATFFEQQFTDICSEIEEISLKYFYSIDEGEWEEAHKRLIEVDSYFKYVPIDDSKDSSDLCAAHAQRIISAAIYKDVWKPLRSEVTFQNPDFGTFLAKISDALDRSTQNGRTANVWTALTMRALQALDAEAAIVSVPQSEQNLCTSNCNRASSVVSEVFRVLGPMVSVPRIELFKADLHAVVDSSVNVWNTAQTGRLRITIDIVLDRAQREEWRSKRFDPVASSADGHNLDLTSRTRPRVFTLFPRIVARTQEKLMPGSWPQVEPIVIHPGIGLPEWSPLVVRGKHDQEERAEKLNKAIENMKKELHRSRRGSGNGRNESTGNLASRLPSPSTQWKNGGAMNKESKIEYE
ncbi:hypothetical protein BJ878DRAFT_337252 [Calycina marina]|uniref:Uncharacterized protein n=1 Tax=Calycina marina TaxID=1763456 RepID=A0A9P7YUD8_9HELO|nr:hypothetical protein BJ878DRAFT_337252 [Calycina marina]